MHAKFVFEWKSISINKSKLKQNCSAPNLNRPFLKFNFDFVVFQDSGWKGLSIDDCDGTACGGEVCLHEGVCVLEENRPEGYNCECLDEFRGRNCEIHSLCEDNGGCQNGATCRVEEERSEVICDCAYGYVGDFCEIGKFVNLSTTLILLEINSTELKM